MKNDPLPRRGLLVLDEGHSIENQLLGQIGISISKRKLQKFFRRDTFENIEYDYDDSITGKWLVLLRNIKQELGLAISSELNSDETKVEAEEYWQKIKTVIDDIQENPNNWIVSNIEKENRNIIEVEFKPLDLSGYCKKLFEKCDRILIMSATILDVNAFCRSIGLDTNFVKFIGADSNFPVQNRPIFQMNTAYLNYFTLQDEFVQGQIANAVDDIMTIHGKEKGIIHCTSYAQVNFVKRYLSTQNKIRLKETDSERPNGRDEVLAEHFNSEKPTVLISPSLDTGLDLKDERSRFQIIVKVPYPNINDRWIEAKRSKDEKWYKWRTAIRLVQAYGRSVRSKEDWAITYVLDSGFKTFVMRNNLPGWFIKAIKA